MSQAQAEWEVIAASLRRGLAARAKQTNELDLDGLRLLGEAARLVMDLELDARTLDATVERHIRGDREPREG